MSVEEEAALTSEERIEWLRARGVLIDLSASEKALRSKSKEETEEETNSDTMTSVSIVMIPANDKEPCEEINIRIKKDGVGDQVLLDLKKVFATHDSIDTSKLQETASKQFGNMDLKVKESTISKIAQEGNVEVFALARPHQDNGMKAVNIYLDEAGQLKNLPSNSRATAIANLCGFKNVPFVGDVFIGRLQVLPNCIKNISFHLSEISSDAAWLKGVEAQNYSYGVATNQVAMDTDLLKKTGGVNAEDNYKWDEDEATLDISITKPEMIRTTKDLVVKFHSKSMSLASKDQSWSLNIPLLRSVSVDDCTWTMNEKTIEISLEKTTEGIWGTLNS